MVPISIRRNQFRNNTGSKWERVNFKIWIRCRQLQEVAAEFFIMDRWYMRGISTITMLWPSGKQTISSPRASLLSGWLFCWIATSHNEPSLELMDCIHFARLIRPKECRHLLLCFHQIADIDAHSSICRLHRNAQGDNTWVGVLNSRFWIIPFWIAKRTAKISEEKFTRRAITDCTYLIFIT